MASGTPFDHRRDAFGLRRRHSAPLDDGPDDNDDNDDGVPPDSTSSPRPTDRRRAADAPMASRPLDDASSSSSSVSRDGPRVRFSLEADRSDDWRRGSMPQRLAPTKRPSLPSLLTDADASSASARSRNRGYSLRRALFTKNAAQPFDTTQHGEAVELDPHGTEAGPSTATPSHPGSDAGKKSGQDRSLFEQVPVYEEFELPPRPDPARRGIAGVPVALPNYEAWFREKAARTAWIRRLRQDYQRARKWVLRVQDVPPSKDGRHIDLDPSRKQNLVDERTGKQYVDNSIRSSRYNAWNFVPKQLWAQFSKLANFYFLCVSILQMIPGLSTTGTYTTIVPLLFFVCISIAREGYDDYRRYRLDKEENNSETLVLHAYQPVLGHAHAGQAPSRSASMGPHHWALTAWKDVKVGDVIKLSRDQPIPADIVLLRASGENGMAYIETMALDGETNLKSKSPAPNLAKACDSDERLAASDAHVVVEDPNLDLYNFEGRVTLNGETAPLSGNEVVYRGSILRNTAEAIGMVIYTGEECKIRMNSNKNPRIKAPALQSLVNRIVVIIVIFVLLLSVFNTVAYQLWSRNFEAKAWYLHHAVVHFGQIIVSFIIMFNTMIPLSLYVSLEIVKVGQLGLFADVDMYDEASNTPMEARTTTINEELGQISYIFSDKTGTLTDNSMKFRKLSVGGTAWLHDTDLKEEAARAAYKERVQRGRLEAKGKRPSESLPLSPGGAPSPAARPSRDSSPHTPQSPVRWKSSARPAKAQPEISTLEMLLYLQRKPYTLFAKKARFFLLSLALCHTCLPETREDGSINFQAASPDELALVQAASEMGFIVMDKNAGILTIKTFPKGTDEEPVVEQYEVLDAIEFSSKRKRMSVVVRFPDNRICVVSKGADTIMMKLLKHAKLALEKTVEIERRASRRKFIEAEQAIARRKSEAREARRSVARSSISLSGRRSIGGVDRLGMATNTSNGRQMSDAVEGWLNEREREVDASLMDEDQTFYEPRPSAQYSRASTSSALSRSSLQDHDFDLVDEALVVDEPLVIERCFQHINDFATEGLRTLLYGYRFLSEDEYKGWKKVYRDATTSLTDRQMMIEKAGELIERDLELAGATAIEDKLQKGVPETIDKLRRANIKMWMLTGDKRETAINIGHSCRLIKDYSAVTVLDHETGRVGKDMASTLVAINNEEVAHAVVVVDGQTLSTIENDPSYHALFLDLAIVADSVICCRASPSQKAGLVKAIRNKVKKSITLAIGDGANDIAMIQEAHVGIGITGKEGLQAARTSDYSIAQFRFLSKLLLVHGRWNYVRVCKYTLATFWKEMTFFLTQALYQRWCGYTGTSLHESWSLSMFNTLFTSLPVIFLGMFDQDLLPATLIAVPELYSKGQLSHGFNVRVYCWWMFVASAEACLVFFSALRLFGRTDSTPFSILPGPRGQGSDNDLFPLGNLVFTAVVILVSMKLLGIEMHNLTYIQAVGALLSIGGLALWNIVLAAAYSKHSPIYAVYDGLFHRWGRDPTWWLVLVLILLALFVLEISFRAVKASFFPSDTDLFQSLEQIPSIRQRFDRASTMELELSRQRLALAGYPVDDNDEYDETQRKREDEVHELLQARQGATATAAAAADTELVPTASHDWFDARWRGEQIQMREMRSPSQAGLEENNMGLQDVDPHAPPLRSGSLSQGHAPSALRRGHKGGRTVHF